MRQPLEIDRRNGNKPRVVTDRNVGYKYGYRGTHAAVRYLSPYEFTMDWEIQRATYPRDAGQRFNKAQHHNDANLTYSPYHTYLTESGKQKLRLRHELLPGVDYRIHGDEGITQGRTWVAFPESAATLRHEWVMVRRIRSAVPKFDGAPLLKNGSKNDHARHMSVFFRPWTLDEDHVDEHVPHAINLCSDDVAWQDAWVQWCNGNVLSQQSKHLIINFQAVFCMRQEDDLPTGDKKTDTSIILTVEERKSALRTCMRQSKDGDGKMTNDSSAEASFKLVQQAWGTLTSNTFDRSKHVK